jgi:pheromone a factor receptor
MRHHRVNASVLDSHLQSRDASLSSVRYYRLMAVSTSLGIWGVGWLSASFRALNYGGNNPLPSWEVIHSGDSTVMKIPTTSLTPESIAINLALWWAVPGSAYIYFILFGASREVLSDYQKFWVWFRIRVLRQTVPMESMSTTEYVLPSHVLRDMCSILTALLSLDLQLIIMYPRIS